MANDDIEHEKILRTNGLRKLASLLALTNLSSLRRSSFCADGAHDANPDSSTPCKVSLRVAFLCTRVARAIQSCGIPRFCRLNTKSWFLAQDPLLVCYVQRFVQLCQLSCTSCLRTCEASSRSLGVQVSPTSKATNFTRAQRSSQPTPSRLNILLLLRQIQSNSCVETVYRQCVVQRCHISSLVQVHHLANAQSNKPQLIWLHQTLAPHSGLMFKERSDHHAMLTVMPTYLHRRRVTRSLGPSAASSCHVQDRTPTTGP